MSSITSRVELISREAIRSCHPQKGQVTSSSRSIKICIEFSGSTQFKNKSASAFKWPNMRESDESAWDDSHNLFYICDTLDCVLHCLTKVNWIYWFNLPWEMCLLFSIANLLFTIGRRGQYFYSNELLGAQLPLHPSLRAKRI
jgi:hypothetical protein